MDNFIDIKFFLDAEYVDKFIDLYNSWVRYNDPSHYDNFVNYYTDRKKELVASFIVLYNRGCTRFPCHRLLMAIFGEIVRENAERASDLHKQFSRNNDFWYTFLQEIYVTL